MAINVSTPKVKNGWSIKYCIAFDIEVLPDDEDPFKNIIFDISLYKLKILHHFYNIKSFFSVKYSLINRTILQKICAKK